MTMANEIESDGATRAARYRELSAALRALAASLETGDLRKELYAIARCYEVLAKHAPRLEEMTADPDAL